MSGPLDRIARRRLAIAIGGVVGVAALAGVTWLGAHAENAPAPAPGVTAAPNPAGAPPPAGAPAPGTNPASDSEAAPAPTRTPKTTVRIVFKVIPPNRATVSWGKKRLGLIKPKAPLIVERPRDSGPLDVVVRTDGYLPVHTRAYTFTDSTVAVKVTPLDKKNTIYGYREAPPPDADGGVTPGSDGGAAPAGAAVPAGANGPDGGVPPRP